MTEKFIKPLTEDLHFGFLTQEEKDLLVREMTKRIKDFIDAAGQERAARRTVDSLVANKVHMEENDSVQVTYNYSFSADDMRELMKRVRQHRERYIESLR